MGILDKLKPAKQHTTYILVNNKEVPCGVCYCERNQNHFKLCAECRAPMTEKYFIKQGEYVCGGCDKRAENKA